MVAVCSGAPSITSPGRQPRPFRRAHGAHPNVIVLAPCREPVRLRSEELVLRRAGLLEWCGLEVAGRYGLAVVPADLKSANAHVGRLQGVHAASSREESSVVVVGPLARCGGNDRAQPIDRLLSGLNRPLTRVNPGTYRSVPTYKAFISTVSWTSLVHFQRQPRALYLPEQAERRGRTSVV